MRRAARKTRVWLACVLIVATSLGLLATAFLHHAPPLTEAAHIAAPWPDGWDAGYAWISDHQFLYWEHWMDAWHWEPGIHDIATQTYTRSAVMRHVLYSADSTRITVTTSPTQPWVIVSGASGYVAGFSLDGTRLTHPRYNDFDAMSWMQDGLHCVGWSISPSQGVAATLIICNVANPRERKGIPLSPELTDQLASFRGSIPDTVVTPQNHMLMSLWDKTNLGPTQLYENNVLGSFDVLELEMTPTVRPLHRYHVPLPPGSRLQNVLLSPRGDRIVYACQFVRELSVVDRLLHRLLPNSPSRPQRTYELWTSRLDGKNQRLLGYLPLTFRTDVQPEDMQWLPDGTKLSFLYKGSLWTISTD